MSRFKVGDKVVIAVWPYGNIPKGTVDTVDVIRDWGNGRIRVHTQKYGFFDEGHLELEDVYNSPLYKALK